MDNKFENDQDIKFINELSNNIENMNNISNNDIKPNNKENPFLSFMENYQKKNYLTWEKSIKK